MRDRYSYNSYQSGGGVMGQNPLGQDQPNPLPRSPQASPPNQAGKPLPPIMGSPLPDAGMKSGAMGSVSPEKPTFTPKQYEQEAAAKKNLSKGYNTGPAGGLMGAGVPQGSPAQGPGNPASQDPMSQGTQMLSQLWGGALGDVASGVPVGQEEPAQFAMGGPVANPGIAGLKNRMIQKRMGRGTAPGSSAAEVYRNTMQDLQAGHGPMSSEDPKALQEMIEEMRKSGVPMTDSGISFGLEKRKDDWNLDWTPDPMMSVAQWNNPDPMMSAAQWNNPDPMMSVAAMDSLGMGDFYRAGHEDDDFVGPRQYPHQDIVEKASAAYGVDKNLIRAVVLQESVGDPNAVSPVGAEGLMQLMPSTGKDLGLGPGDAFDPELNVMAGTRHLRRLLDKYDGNVELALAAYNAGEGNVARYGGVPPFRETKHYVQAVPEHIEQFAHGGGIGGLRDQSQDIASKGRYGDSMLLHVRPDEVSGIESAIGRPLSVNPETGNPEAWALTTSLLVGALLGAGIGGAGGFATTGDWKGAVAGAGIGALGGAAGGALGGAAGGGGVMASMAGAASGASMAQGVAAPIQQALTPAPEHKNVVDPFASSMPGGSSGGMQAARGGVTAAGLGMRSSGTPSVPGRLPGGSLNRRRRLLS